MLDLEKLRQKLDLALSRETEESLSNWLLSVRQEKYSLLINHIILRNLIGEGALESYLKNAPPVNSLINPDLILGFKGITYLENGEAVLCEHYQSPPPEPFTDTNFQKNMTRISQSLFFV